jgi:predicted Zn-dependent protease
MSRTIGFSILAVSLLAAACGGGERPGTSTVSTGGTTPARPASTTVESATGTGVSGTTETPVTVSYADAEVAFRSGHYREAADLFTGYAEGHPDNPWGHYMLGLSAWKAGDHERALTAFDQALRLDPSHRKSLLNSARVLLETNRPKEALERIEKALAIEPLSGEALRLQGRARDELGQVPEAIDAYHRAIAIDDRDAWSMNNLGLIYIQQGRSDAALPPLARAVELKSNAPAFQNNLGNALERSGYFSAARTAYQAALTADSGYVKASAGLTRVTGRVDQDGEGEVDLAALSQEFQSQMAQWRDSTATTDSVQAGGMARDSVQD